MAEATRPAAIGVRDKTMLYLMSTRRLCVSLFRGPGGVSGSRAEKKRGYGGSVGISQRRGCGAARGLAKHPYSPMHHHAQRSSARSPWVKVECQLEKSPESGKRPLAKILKIFSTSKVAQRTGGVLLHPKALRGLEGGVASTCSFAGFSPLST